MVKTYKEKASTVEAVEFTDVLEQSPDVANLIGATSMSVDMKAKKTEFSVDADGEVKSYSVAQGEVIAKISGEVVVMAAKEFYAKYEAV